MTVHTTTTPGGGTLAHPISSYDEEAYVLVDDDGDGAVPGKSLTSVDMDLAMETLGKVWGRVAGSLAPGSELSRLQASLADRSLSDIEPSNPET